MKKKQFSSCLILYCILFLCRQAVGQAPTDVFSTTPGGFVITHGMLDKPINKITFGGAHNCYSYNSFDVGWPFVYGTELNQDLDVNGQFAAGANVFDFDVTKYSISVGNPWVVRHGAGTGFRILQDFLGKLVDVAAANPNTVFIMELADLREGDGGEQPAEISSKALEYMTSTGFRNRTYNWRAYYGADGTPLGYSNLANWLSTRGGYPTLREMISSGQNIFLVGPYYTGWRHTIQAGDETSVMGGALSVVAGKVSPATGDPATYLLPELEFIPDDNYAGDRYIARDLNAGERIYQLAREMERQLNSNSPTPEYALSSVQLDFLKPRSSTDFNVADACNRLNFERFGWDYFGKISKPMYLMPKGLLIKPVSLSLTNYLTYTSYGFNENAVADQDLYSAVLMQSGGTVTYDFGTAAHPPVTSWAAAFQETPKSITVQVSNDNSNWTQISGVQRSRLDHQCWTIWDGSRDITERYIRFTFNNNENQLYEIACFNKNMAGIETVPCTAPNNLTSTNIGPFGATISWSAVTGAQSYTAEYKSAAAAAWTSAGTAITGTSVTLGSLDALTTYS